MKTSNLLAEHKDVILQCIEREGLVKNPDIKACRNFVRTNFKEYKSKVDFAYEFSLEDIRSKINDIFKDIEHTPEFLLDAFLDDYFCFGFVIHDFSALITDLYQLEIEGGFYVINSKNLGYKINDLMEQCAPMGFYEDGEYKLLITKIKNSLLKHCDV